MKLGLNEVEHLTENSGGVGRDSLRRVARVELDRFWSQLCRDRDPVAAEEEVLEYVFHPGYGELPDWLLRPSRYISPAFILFQQCGVRVSLAAAALNAGHGAKQQVADTSLPDGVSRGARRPAPWT